MAQQFSRGRHGDGPGRPRPRRIPRDSGHRTSVDLPQRHPGRRRARQTGWGHQSSRSRRTSFAAVAQVDPRPISSVSHSDIARGQVRGHHPGSGDQAAPTRSSPRSVRPGHRHRSAAAKAKGSQPTVAATAPQLVEERRQHPRAGCADRVAEGDGAAVDIDPIPVEAQRIAIGQHLGGERLVDLDQVEALEAQVELGRGASGRPRSAPRRATSGRHRPARSR